MVICLEQFIRTLATEISSS